MPENLVLIEPGKCYHIYNHAIGNENFFREDKNYLFFLQLLKKYLVPICDIYSYALMPNHIHLLVHFNENKNCGTNCSQQLSNLSMLMCNLIIKPIREKALS